MTVRGYDAKYCPSLMRMQMTYTVSVEFLNTRDHGSGIHTDSVKTRITTTARPSFH